MRVWDVSPGYLNRQSLLGEHRELHGIVSIIVKGKKGYSNHPETMRWVGYGWALKQRHKQLSCEMMLRGFTDKSPVTTRSNRGIWPDVYIDEPSQQYEILKSKYLNKEEGRIPLPVNAQHLWSHHKYSVLARNVNAYKEIGRDVAKKVSFSELAMVLSEFLRTRPPDGGIRNSLQHMWGHVSDRPGNRNMNVEFWQSIRLLKEIQKRSVTSQDTYLMSSTALSELMVWLPCA